MDKATGIPPTWKRIRPDEKALWRPGVFALHNTQIGTLYFVATTNVGKRLRDHYAWLQNGTHHCPDLLADWIDLSDRFEWLLVAECSPQTLECRKQALMDEYDGCVYNRKRAIRKGVEVELADLEHCTRDEARYRLRFAPAPLWQY